MKLTKTKLKQIIKEELEKVLEEEYKENPYQRLEQKLENLLIGSPSSSHLKADFEGFAKGDEEWWNEKRRSDERYEKLSPGLVNLPFKVIPTIFQNVLTSYAKIEEGEDPYPEVTRRIKATPTTKQKKEKEEAKKKRAKAGKSTQADLGYSDERMRDLDSWK